MAKTNLVRSRMIAVFLALVLALSTVIPALAAEDVQNSDDPNISADFHPAISQTSASLEAGGTLTLTIENCTDATVTWSSSAPSVASVSGSGTTGTVTAHSAGSAAITATVTSTSGGGSETLTCSVTVSALEVHPNSVHIQGETHVSVGKTVQLTAVISPTNATNTKVTWSSDNKSVATVDSSGNVKGISAGTATITVTTEGGYASDQCTITVEQTNTLVTSIQISGAVSMAVGGKIQLTAEIRPSDATDKSLEWFSSNPDVAAVDDSGLVTGKSSGSATITARAQDGSNVSGTTTVTVQSQTTPTISKTALTLSVGEWETIRVSDVPSGASVSWTVANDNLSISSSGNSCKVTGITAGTTTDVTATIRYDDGQANTVLKCSVTVTGGTLTLSTSALTLSKGSTGTLRATTSLSGGVITWTVANSSIVKLGNSQGTSLSLTALAEGKTTVTATLTESGITQASASCTVTVTAGTLTLSSTSLTLSEGSTGTLRATTSLSGGVITWTVANSSIVKLGNNQGVSLSLTALAEGKTTVTATLTESGITQASASCTVTVTEGTLTLSYSTLTLSEGSTYTLRATTSLSNGVITWSVSNSRIVELDSSRGTSVGLTALATGKATVTATLTESGITRATETCTVTVTDSDLTLSSTSMTLSKGSTGTLRATSSLSDTVVTWTVSNSKIVKLGSSQGTSVKLTALTVGKTTVTATLKRNSKTIESATCSVTVTSDTLTLSSSALTLSRGATGTLRATTSLSSAVINWSVSNSKIVKLGSSQGTSVKLTALAVGTTTVTATLKQSGTTRATATCEVTVTSDSSMISYRSGSGEKVSMKAGDFNTLSTNITGETLDYIEFTALPDDTEGTLYGQNSVKIGKDVCYYYKDTPYIEDVYFLPAANSSGTVYIPFTGCTVKDRTFEGTVKITVSRGDGVVSYTMEQGKSLTLTNESFDAFSKDQCGVGLDYIQFTSVPSAETGTLYEYYSEENMIRVVQGIRYYCSDEYPRISQVLFMPAAGFSGKVEIPFIGYSTDMDSIAGTLVIQVNAEEKLPFTDVPLDAPYYDDVKYVYENDIFKGVTETSFQPDATMTRAQMVTVLWRMNGSPAPQQENPFTDVSADSQFVQAIAWAAETGITKGTTATTFAPDRPISRQQFITILYRYAEKMGYDTATGDTDLTVYPDGDAVNSYAQSSMRWACGNGILEDMEGNLMPGTAAPRYQVAEFLSRFCQSVVPS